MDTPVESESHATPAPGTGGAVVLFDGLCDFCSAAVRFVITRDPAGCFRFASLQSETARRLLQERGVSGPLPDSMVVIEDGRVFMRSAAWLRVVRRLRFPWWLAYGFIVVPRVVRDWAYDAFARRRYRWFGKRDDCMVPTEEMRGRFLDSASGPVN